MAPKVDHPIADLTLTDSSSPQPAAINLSTVFSDANGDSLTVTPKFTLASVSND